MQNIIFLVVLTLLLTETTDAAGTQNYSACN